MNRESNTEGLMYKVIAAVIFVLLVTFIILITAASFGQDDVPPTPGVSIAAESKPATEATETSATEISEPPVTQLVTDTLPPEPVAAPVTETPVTEAPAIEQQAPHVNPDPVSTPSANVSDELAAFLANYPDTVLPVSDDAGAEYINGLIFLGDSTTYGLRAYKMLEGGKETTQVWTPASGTLTLSNASFATVVYPETGEELTIKQAVEKRKPEYLVITLGVNGVSFMGEDYFKSEYKKIIETVKETSPDTKIICQSMFPVAKSYKSLNSINNEKIRAANKWIVEVAAETGVKYVDTYSVLADSEGWLPESYHNGDGMHLNTQSFTVELNNLRTHAYK